MFKQLEGEQGTSPTKQWTISKLKSSRYHKYKMKLCHLTWTSPVQKGASVSKEFALFN